MVTGTDSCRVQQASPCRVGQAGKPKGDSRGTLRQVSSGSPLPHGEQVSTPESALNEVIQIVVDRQSVCPIEESI